MDGVFPRGFSCLQRLSSRNLFKHSGTYSPSQEPDTGTPSRVRVIHTIHLPVPPHPACPLSLKLVNMFILMAALLESNVTLVLR